MQHHLGFYPLYLLPRQSVTPAEAAMLEYAARDGAFAVSDGSHPRQRRTANQLARKGLLTVVAGAEAGWDRGMWQGTITCPGFNALYEARGNRHVDGCGGLWQPDGTCDGCRVLRRLDEEAFEQLLAANAEEARFLGSRARLWCDEHGYARSADWTTDKTCRRPGGSPVHELGFIRV